MATVDRDGDGTIEDAEGAVSRLASAQFVRIVARADGDGVAAAGTLARALSERRVPFQVSTARTAAGRAARTRGGDDAETVLLGAASAPDGVVKPPTDDAREPLSVAAWRIASELGVDRAAASLALAGVVAAGRHPETAPASLLQAVGAERQPGVAVPVTDPVDGLAHSTLVHGPFSGSPDRVREALGDVTTTLGDVEAARSLASATTLATLSADASATAAAAVERALRPRLAGPMTTLGGYADVLDAAARESPGTAVALALGHDASDPALSAWREHGRRAHEAVREGSTGRYDGLLAVRVDGPAPVGTVARLVAAYRSPEPVVAVATDERAAVAVRPDSDPPSPGAKRAVRAAVGDAALDGTPHRAFARLAGDTESASFVAGLREALS